MVQDRLIGADNPTRPQNRMSASECGFHIMCKFLRHENIFEIGILKTII